MDFVFRLAAAAPDAADAPATPGMGDMLIPFLGIGLMFVVMYFVSIRPSKKKEKALKEQVSKMAVGDSVVTIGGIVGVIANIKDDEVTISTSVAHTMMTFKKSSISSIAKRESN